MNVLVVVIKSMGVFLFGKEKSLTKLNQKL